LLVSLSLERRKKLVKKIIVAAIGIALVLGLLYVNDNVSFGSYIFNGFAYILNIWAIFEMKKAFNSRNIKVMPVPLAIAAVFTLPLFYLLNHVSDSGNNGIHIMLLVALCVAGMIFILDTKKTLIDLFSTIFILFYPHAILSSIFWLNNRVGGIAIILCLLFAIACDGFAYLSGSLIKGPKLIPKISPKKTISGAVGGVVGTMAITVLIYFVVEVWELFGFDIILSQRFGNLTLLVYLAMAFFGSIFSQFGDLFASRVKRVLEIKDFGTVLPAHGGIMDRLDSILFSLVFVFVFILAFYS
jgi:phosphatidate cytidylyltransferase